MMLIHTKLHAPRVEFKTPYLLLMNFEIMVWAGPQHNIGRDFGLKIFLLRILEKSLRLCIQSSHPVKL